MAQHPIEQAFDLLGSGTARPILGHALARDHRIPECNAVTDLNRRDHQAQALQFRAGLVGARALRDSGVEHDCERLACEARDVGGRWGTQPWSSGQAKGQVNRLKLLKRQSYGRAGFNLLRRRVLMAA